MTFTGREVHPVIPLLGEAEVSLLRELSGEAAVEEYYHERARMLQLEASFPLKYGFVPEIWKQAERIIEEYRSDHALGVMLLLVLGGNRAAKTEWAAKRVVHLMVNTPRANVWCCQSTETSSQQNQQSVIWKYLPPSLKPESGKTRHGAVTKVVYNQAGGFTENTLVLPNGAQCWFKFYAMKVTSLEGAELDMAWADELVTPDWLEALRYRLVTRNGLELVTFTPVEGYSATVKMLLEGARTLEEVAAELLPRRDFDFNNNLPVPVLAEPLQASDVDPGNTTHTRSGDARESTGKEPLNSVNSRGGQSLSNSAGGAPALQSSDGTAAVPPFDPARVFFEFVPRVQVINNPPLRGRIIYFHTSDNPFGNYPSMKETLKGASRETILMRAYGVPTKSSSAQFQFKDTVHVLPMNRFAALVKRYPNATRYHLVDPCSGRPWFMGWAMCPALNKVIFYREWPSHGHAGAYVEGVGDPGPWAMPGRAEDGDRGPAQKPMCFGLDRYKQEILKLEGRQDLQDFRIGNQRDLTNAVSTSHGTTEPNGAGLRASASHNPPNPVNPVSSASEVIFERWMDCRYGNSALTEREGTTTLIEKMSEIGMEFVAMTGEKKILDTPDGSIDMINSSLYYDAKVAVGEFSPELGRINEPELLVTENCPNMIYALQNWTGKDGMHGACKDPIDILRGFFLSGLGYVGPEMLKVRGGGSY